MSLKNQRLESQFLRVISDIVRNEIKNKDLSLITITKVDITNDLSVATIYFTCLGGKEKQSSDLKALSSATGFIKKELSSKIKMRRVPNLVFKYDDRIDINAEFEKVLQKIK